jgi:hypothetical protein
MSCDFSGCPASVNAVPVTTGASVTVFTDCNDEGGGGSACGARGIVSVFAETALDCHVCICSVSIGRALLYLRPVNVLGFTWIVTLTFAGVRLVCPEYCYRVVGS